MDEITKIDSIVYQINGIYTKDHLLLNNYNWVLDFLTYMWYTDELEFRVNHVYNKGVTILEIIDQIQTFLTRYPDEFIVINVRQFINSQNQSWTFGNTNNFLNHV